MAEADIFSMGVILFLMVAGHMPVQESASPTDPVFSKLCENNPTGFWKQFDEAGQAVARTSTCQKLMNEAKELFLCLMIGSLLMLI